MDKISGIVSSLGLFRNAGKEGDCFDEHISEGDIYSNPLSLVENNKKNFILLVVILLLGFVVVYMMYGDETENIMSSLAENVQKYIGSLLLGTSYLTTSGELKTTKILDADILNDAANVEVDVNEMLML